MSLAARWWLGPLAMLGTVLAAAAAGVPSVLVVVMAIAFSMRWSPRSLALGLGLLLAVDYVRGFDGSMLDVLRYALCGLLILKSRSHPLVRFDSNWHHAVVSLLLLIPAVGLALTVVHQSAAQTREFVIAAGSVAVSALVVRREGVLQPLLIGFAVSMTVSAIDIVAQLVGLPYLGVTSRFGTSFSGFSMTRTQASPLFAMAMLIAASPYAWSLVGRRRPVVTIRVVVFLACGIALVLTAGRGGLVALVAVAATRALVLCVSRPRVVLVATGALLLAGVAYLASPYAEMFLRDGDISSGRNDLNAAAFEAFLSSPLTGVDPTLIGDPLRPHTPILFFAIQVGAVGFVGAIALSLIVGWLALRGCCTFDSRVRLGGEFLVVATVIGVLEPSGFFVGLSKVLLLLTAIVLVTGVDRVSIGNERALRLKGLVV